MIDLNRMFTVGCKRCHHEERLILSEKDYTKLEEERSISYETEHTFVKKYGCVKCSNEILFGVHIYEFPIGILNYTEFFGNGYLKLK